MWPQRAPRWLKRALEEFPDVHELWVSVFTDVSWDLFGGLSRASGSSFEASGEPLGGFLGASLW
eukprot:2365986-Pyramimonas_sp.AAC.1